MTQEQKDLLKKVLCEMLPYVVKLYHPDDYGDNIGKLESINISNDECVIWNYNGTDTDIFDIEICKPYLRPMSSMTEEEKENYFNLRTKAWDVHVNDYWYYDNFESYDYLNSIHVDYRGLISMGLALESPEGMYKTK